MVLTFGVAIDLMRSESDRIALQATIDRAVLAAAPLAEEREAREVVESYLRAADIDPGSVRVQSFEDDRATRITVDAEAQTQSLFLDVFGEETMIVPISSQAREEKWDTEVAVVLDISGSMDGDKIENMQSAAISFAGELFQGAQEDNNLTSLAIVPYNETVNMGSEVGSWFPMTMEHTFSRCAAFVDMSHFETLDITESFPVPRMMHYDWNETGTNHHGVVRRPRCVTDDYAAILPWTTDIERVRPFVNALEADGSTSIGLGVKWATALLDPSTRPQMDDWIGRGMIGPEYGAFPTAYGTPQVRKVLVVMTDGANNRQRNIRPERRSGPSGVFVNRAGLSVPEATGSAATGTHGIDDIDGRSNWSPAWHATRARAQDWQANGGRYNGYPWWEDADRRNWTGFDGKAPDPNDPEAEVWTQYSIWSEDRGQFWVKNVRTGSDWSRDSGGYYADMPGGGTDAIELTFAEFYAAVPLRFWNFYDRRGDDPNRVQLDWDTRRWLHRETNITNSNASRFAVNTIHPNELDDRLSKICETARNRGILVYSIAFQAPPEGRAAMEDCAGLENPGRYFNITGLDISTAFDGILASLDKLRLTQ
jgi:Mg-chelatase subunit ChlD